MHVSSNRKALINSARPAASHHRRLLPEPAMVPGARTGTDKNQAPLAQDRNMEGLWKTTRKLVQTEEKAKKSETLWVAKSCSQTQNM